MEETTSDLGHCAGPVLARAMAPVKGRHGGLRSLRDMQANTGSRHVDGTQEKRLSGDLNLEFTRQWL